MMTVSRGVVMPGRSSRPAAHLGKSGEVSKVLKRVERSSLFLALKSSEGWGAPSKVHPRCTEGDVQLVLM